MSIFTEAWYVQPQQQQFPPASPEGRGAGSHGKDGDADGPEGPGAEDPSEGFTGPGGAADSPEARGGRAPDAAPEGAEPAPEQARAAPVETKAAPTATPAPPSLDSIAAQKEAVAAKHGYDVADLSVEVNDLGELEFTAKGAGYGRAMDLARPKDPFAAAFHDFTVMLSPFATKAAGYGFGVPIDPMTGAAQPTGFAGDTGHVGDPPGKEPQKVGDEPQAPTEEDPGDFTLPPPYVSPVDRAAGEMAVSQFLSTMRENVARASGRLARV